MRILAGGRVLLAGQYQSQFLGPQDALPEQFKILLCLVDGAERRRQIQAKLNRTPPACRSGSGAALSRMKRVLPALLICAIVHATNVARGQSLEATFIKSVQADVHSAVVDMPRVISLPPASPESWETFWDTLPSSVRLDEQRPVNDQAAQTRRDPHKIELLKVNSTANIRCGPFASAEIIGIAPAGAEVQVGLRNSGWVQIIDPWSLRTGWIHSKFLAPSNTLSAPAGAIVG
jgi:hypothetical protein